MRVLLDSVGNKHSGGAQVLMEIVGALVVSDYVSCIILLASPARLRTFTLPISDKLIVRDIDAAEGPFGRLWWAVHGLGRVLADTPHDIFLGMNGFGPCCSNRPVVLFIQQSLPYSREALAMCPRSERMRMGVIRWLTKRAARRATHVMVQSEPMRSLLCTAFRISPTRVSVHMPSAPLLHYVEAGPLEKLFQMKQAGGNCILYVGNQSAYKNLPVISQAMQRSEKSGVTCFATLPATHELVISGNMMSLGVLNGEELSVAYRLAGILVMPSFTETVGLPMLEAMRAGTPVLAADRPYAHAVCEDAALFFDPNSPADLAEQASRLLSDHDLRNDMIQRAHAMIARRDQAHVYGGMVKKLAELAC